MQAVNASNFHINYKPANFPDTRNFVGEHKLSEGEREKHRLQFPWERHLQNMGR